MQHRVAPVKRQLPLTANYFFKKVQKPLDSRNTVLHIQPHTKQGATEMPAELINIAIARLRDANIRHIGTAAFVDTLIECMPGATLEEIADILNRIRAANQTKT